MGVCLETDVFYRFLTHRQDPSTAESHTQNTAVTRAFLNAARSFYSDGYDVFVDGVIGPWWLDTIREVLPVFQYALLHADLATVLQRTTQRANTKQASANPELVRTMHGQFEAVINDGAEAIDTAEKTPEQVFEEFLVRQARGDFDC